MHGEPKAATPASVWSGSGASRAMPRSRRGADALRFWRWRSVTTRVRALDKLAREACHLPVYLYLVRHGETVWNVEGRVQGHEDSRLTARGEAQARAAGRALSRIAFSHAYVSPSGRCRRTFELMGESLVLKPPVTVTEEIREIGHGLWEGHTEPEVKVLTPESWALYRESPDEFPGAPGGESLHAVRRRAMALLRRAVSAASSGSRLLFVTHGVTTKVILTTVSAGSLKSLWAPPPVYAGSISRLAADDTVRSTGADGTEDHEGFRVLSWPEEVTAGKPEDG